jgi:DNA-binding transcriptional MerR regulator
MTAGTTQRTYSIKEAAALTGLPATTLRYYESIGVISPVDRGSSSKHRVYSDDDVDLLVWVACLSATGMSVSDMRRYLANRELGPTAAHEQVELLTAQQKRLEVEAGQIAVRQRYVDLKIDYWQAVERGDEVRAARLADQARSLADELKTARSQN